MSASVRQSWLGRAADHGNETIATHAIGTDVTMIIDVTVRGKGTGATTTVETEIEIDTNPKAVTVIDTQVGTRIAPRITDEMFPPTMRGTSTSALHPRSIFQAYSIIVSVCSRTSLLQGATLLTAAP